MLLLAPFIVMLIGFVVRMWLSDRIERRLRSRYPDTWRGLSKGRPQLPPLLVASFVLSDQAWQLGDRELIDWTLQMRWLNGGLAVVMVATLLWIFSRGAAGNA